MEAVRTAVDPLSEISLEPPDSEAVFETIRYETRRETGRATFQREYKREADMVAFMKGVMPLDDDGDGEISFRLACIRRSPGSNAYHLSQEGWDELNAPEEGPISFNDMFNHSCGIFNEIHIQDSDEHYRMPATSAGRISPSSWHTTTTVPATGASRGLTRRRTRALCFNDLKEDEASSLWDAIHALRWQLGAESALLVVGALHERKASHSQYLVMCDHLEAIPRSLLVPHLI